MATIPQLHTRILHTPKEDKPSLEKGPSSRIIERRLKEAEICARNGGLLKILNEALLAEKYGEDVLPEEIEILNLSCSGIERMVNFSLLLLTQLTICDLGDNYLTSIAPLDACPNLMKLDVSNNQVCCVLCRANTLSSNLWVDILSSRHPYIGLMYVAKPSCRCDVNYARLPLHKGYYCTPWQHMLMYMYVHMYIHTDIHM